MKEEIHKITSRILQFLEEIESYEFHKQTMLNRAEKIQKKYERGKYNYIEYKALIKDLLKGKSKKEWLEYYDVYTFSLLKKIEQLLSQINAVAHVTTPSHTKLETIQKEVPIMATEKDVVITKVKPTTVVQAERKEEEIIAKKTPAKEEPEISVTIPNQEKKKILSKIKDSLHKKKDEKQPEIHIKADQDTALKKLIHDVDEINKEVPSLHPEAASKSGILTTRIKLAFIKLHSLLKKKQRITTLERVKKEKEIYTEQKETTEEREKSISPFKGPEHPGAAVPTPTEVTVKAMEKKKEIMNGPFPSVVEEQKEGVKFKLSFKGIKKWYGHRVKEQKKFLSKKVTIPHSIHVEGLRKDVKRIEETPTEPTALKEEVKSMRDILEKRKTFKIYEPSYIGIFANVIIRKFTFYLIDTFPDFFKKLYDSLRSANIPVLSNTYVNIMLLSTILSSITGFIFFSLFFVATNNPFFLILPKAIIMSLLVGGVVFLMFYTYPLMKSRTREADINTNLPFAINNISAVAGSGVPPTKMFTLLVESGEYSQISVEFSKIVEYIDLFGYDLLTAIKSVALTTPSIMLKEFLEGVVSTIESGGNIKDYLKEKADSAMLNYELTRQRYLEDISTYSDVYTGILIAAPLFFIVALSLVSMLGGTIGGIEINILIVMGAYVIIPGLNLLFLVFLELTQPAM